MHTRFPNLFSGRPRWTRGRRLSLIAASWMLAGVFHAVPATAEPSLAEAHLRDAWSRIHERDFAAARVHLDNAIEHAAGTAPTIEAISRAFLGLTDLHRGNVDVGLAAVARALDLSARANDPLATWMIELIHALARQQLGQPEAADQGIDSALAALDRLTSADGNLSLTVLQVLAADSLPPQMWSQMSLMTDLLGPLLGQALRGLTLVARADLEAARGDEQRALATLEESRSIQDPLGLSSSHLASSRARVLRKLGQEAQAAREEKLAGEGGEASIDSLFSMVGGVFGASSQPVDPTAEAPSVPPRYAASHAKLLSRLGRFLALRRSHEAMPTFEQAISMADEIAAPALNAEVLELAARGAFSLAQDTRAIELERRALDLASQNDWPCRRSRALMDLAAMLAWSGDIDGAMESAREGLDTAEQLGRDTLVEEARARISLLENAERYPAAVREELVMAVEGPEASPDWPGVFELDLISSLIAALENQPGRAWQLVGRAERGAVELGMIDHVPAIDRARELLTTWAAALDATGSDTPSPVELDSLLDRLETPASRAFLALCDALEP